MPIRPTDRGTQGSAPPPVPNPGQPSPLDARTAAAAGPARQAAEQARTESSVYEFSEEEVRSFMGANPRLGAFLSELASRTSDGSPSNRFIFSLNLYGPCPGCPNCSSAEPNSEGKQKSSS